MVLENNKKHKIHVGVVEDKISNLPDELIHRILSFLPTKCVMSTCILSKRWKYLSNSIPTLDFRCWRTRNGRKKLEKELETKCFMNFLDTLLFVYEKPNIQKFYLALDKFLDDSRVNRWIGTITKRKVEEFYLRVTGSSASSIFPLSFFTCDSLTLLDLDFGVTTGGKINIPNTVYFPKLKILQLGSLSFVDETSTRKLFSNCPILEELSLNGCWITIGLCIVNLSLKHLSIKYCHLTNSKVTISAPNLLTFSYTEVPPFRPSPDFVLDSFPSLVEADVDFRIHERSEYMNKAFVKLFEKLASAKLLKICVDLPWFQEADILLTGLLSFNNLIHMEISSLIPYMSVGSVSTSIARAFFRFLQLSPNLESILFAQSFDIPEEEDDGCRALDPKSLLPHLKSIKFKNFAGGPMELNAIKLLLKYAGFLETVTIVASPWPLKDHQESMQQLLMFPRPANCVVEFLTSSENA